jgi:hypothetical protein
LAYITDLGPAASEISEIQKLFLSAGGGWLYGWTADDNYSTRFTKVRPELVDQFRGIRYRGAQPR